MQDILAKYQGQIIGINLNKPFRIDGAELLQVSAGHITLRCTEDGHLHHFPYASVLQLIEDASGVKVPHVFTHDDVFPLVVKVAHLSEYAPIV